MELVAVDFMKDCVEETLRTFFRVIRTERMNSLSERIPVSKPSECAAFLVHLFVVLANDLSDDVSRRTEDDHFRVRLSRDRNAILKTPSPAKLEERAPATKSPTKPCAGHLGKQLKAVFPDGSPYRCKWGKSCIFQHVGKARKSMKELLDVIALMPTVNQEDLKKAARASA